MNGPPNDDPPRVPDHELFRCIGRGSYGEVWLARNVMGTWRAVKFVYRRSFEDDRPYEREFDGIRRFEPVSHSHPSQLSVLHVGRDNEAGCFYYVMELADDAGAGAVQSSPPAQTGAIHGADATLSFQSGKLNSETYVPKTLKTDLRHRGRLAFDYCLTLASSLVTAVEHLHQHGLVHRDIKPANIIFVHGLPKLADIGLVTDTAASMTFVGTEGYLPPEGLQHPQQTDLFALGKVLYEMATGRDRTEFPTLPPMEKLSDTERQQMQELNAVVLKACDPSHTRRYRNAGEFQRDLLALQAGHSVERQQKLMRQLKRVALALGVLAMLGVLAGVWQWTRGNSLRAQEKAREEARLNARLRAHLLADARQLGGDSREAGWTTNAFGKVTNAVSIELGDDARDQAAATLLGFEARLVWHESNAAASSFAWDSGGKRLLIGGQYARTDELQSPTRIFSMSNRTCSPMTTNASPGPVAWDRNGSPVQFRAGPDPMSNFLFYLKRPGVIEDKRHSITNFGHVGAYSSAVTACSIDGSLAALAFAFRSVPSSKTEQGVWLFETQESKLLAQTNLAATALAFSPDASLLAMGFRDGKVNVYTLPNLTSVANFETEDNQVTCLAWQRDPLRLANSTLGSGWRLAAGDDAAVVFVWELAKRRLIARLRGSSYKLFSLAFNPDGTLLASGGRGPVRLWDLANERQVLQLPGALPVPMDHVMALAFSPDGRHLAGGSKKEFLAASTWVAELSPHRGIQPLYGLNGPIEHMWLSADGRYVAGLSHTWRLGVWEVASGRLLHIFIPPKTKRGAFIDNSAAVFHPNGRLYFSSGEEVRVWDLDNGEEVDSIPLGYGLADAMTLATDGRLLLLRREEDPSVSRGRLIWILRDLLGPNRQTPIHIQPDTDWDPYFCAFPASERYFVVLGHSYDRKAGRNELVVVYDAATGRELWRESNTMPKGHSSLNLSADGVAVAVLTAEGKYRWLALSNQAPLEERQVELGSARFDFADAPDGGVGLLRRGSKTNRLVVGAQYGPLREARFSTDGRRLVWATDRGLVIVAHLDEIERQLKESGFEW